MSEIHNWLKILEEHFKPKLENIGLADLVLMGGWFWYFAPLRRFGGGWYLPQLLAPVAGEI